ncbi:MAG: hypothetical protein J1F09_05055 [Oscillospiraceae bacterium]|nr:hypothetical protein [Oscillospiraceae bacterium]
MNISKDKPYVLDDRCVISKEVEEMSPEERKREIARLEEEGRKEKERKSQGKKAV